MNIIFTKHSIDTFQERNIIHEEVTYALRHLDTIIKKHGAYFYRKKFPRGIIEVVCEKTGRNIRVITFYWL